MKKLLVVLILILLTACNFKPSLSDKLAKLDYVNFEIAAEKDGNIFRLLLIENDVMYYTYNLRVSPSVFDKNQSYNAKIYAMDKEGNESIVIDNIGYQSVVDFSILNDEMYYVTFYQIMRPGDNDIYPIVNVYKEGTNSNKESIIEYMTSSTSTITKLYKFKGNIYGPVQDIIQAPDETDNYHKHDVFYNFSQDKLVYDIDTSIKDKDENKKFHQVNYASLIDVNDDLLTFSTMLYRADADYSSGIYFFDGKSISNMKIEDEIIENPIVVNDNIVYASRPNQNTHNQIKVINKDNPRKSNKLDIDYQDFRKFYQDDDLLIVAIESTIGIQSLNALSISKDLEILIEEVNLFEGKEGYDYYYDSSNVAKIIYKEDKIIIQSIK